MRILRSVSYKRPIQSASISGQQVILDRIGRADLEARFAPLERAVNAANGPWINRRVVLPPVERADLSDIRDGGAVVIPDLFDGFNRSGVAELVAGIVKNMEYSSEVLAIRRRASYTKTLGLKALSVCCVGRFFRIGT
jgi:hypothetical protein